MTDSETMTRVRPFALAALLTATAAAAEPVGDHRHVQDVDVPSGLVRLVVPDATSDVARPDLGDLRLVDPDGVEVPYQVVRPRRVARRLVPATVVAAEVLADHTLVTLRVDKDEPIEALRIRTPAKEMLKAVTVEASADGRRWRPLVERRPVFRLARAESLRIELPEKRAWRHIRVRIDDRRSAPIPIIGVDAQLGAGAERPVVAVEATIVERFELAGRSKPILEAPFRNLYVTEVVVRAKDSLFTRSARLDRRRYLEGEVREERVAEGSIFRVAVDGAPAVSELGVAVEAVLEGASLALTIEDGDSRPLEIDRVELMVLRPELRFHVAVAGRLQLFVGNRKATTPRYDIARLGVELDRATAGTASVASLMANPRFVPSDPLPQVPERGATIDLDGWEYRKRVELAGQGVQRLELDLDVLSRVRDPARELRIVDGDVQIPYVRDASDVVRSFAPVVRQVTDDVPAGRTRYALELPRGGLPVTHVSCEVGEALFERSVTMFEEVTDRRGEIRRTGRGSATWRKLPSSRPLEEPGRRFRIGVRSTARLHTSTLYVEIDDGDNPPIAPSEFRVHYRTSRLVFKAGRDAGAYLFYSNRKARAPRYDIALVAAELLRADKLDAELGEEEVLRESERWWTGSEGAPSGAGRVLLYGGLAVAVGVFLFVIAKLLPATKEGGEG